MFGYIRPLRDELKVREFEQFRACYCGMCHCLGSYGFPARFILNYDFTYLAMLLWEPDTRFQIEKRRCIASPCRKKCCCVSNAAFEKASGYSLILAWWKLRDSIADERFLKTIPARLASLALYRAYRKAAAMYPGFNAVVEERLRELNELEDTRCTSLDNTADKFALLLASAADSDNGNETRRRELFQILYHTGRWIYIVDASDDIKKDSESGAFNAVASRFGIDDGVMDAEIKDTLALTLDHSRNIAGAAFELMPDTVWSGVIRNIIGLGMNEVGRRVLNGTWKRPRSGAPK